ncbi:MAG: sodium:solute symporter family protein [Acidobacteriota bacterium]|nr:MAG: sodium:solute symporter family protein [Acidobacteriota bacterium]
MVSLILIFSIFLLIGGISARRSRNGTTEDFLVAGRAMPLWLATMTMTATWVDGGYLLGTAEGVYKSSIPLGLQGGLCFGLSLILGGLIFARRMRRMEFTTLIDPFEARFGKGWAAVLFIPAVLGEIFWSGELLVAIGSTIGVATGMKLGAAILISAGVVILYTIAGGMWSVAYTDALQLCLVMLGLALAIPFVMGAAGGWEASWATYLTARADRGWILPGSDRGFWTSQSIVNWWDVSLMLIFGGIPWNCYFQRVLSCRTPDKARWHSITAGMLTIILTFPPLLIGLAAFNFDWPAGLLGELQANPSRAMPMMFQHATPWLVATLGIGAIVAAVTSSFSSSILSAASMLSWNCCRRLIWPNLSTIQMKRLIRLSILLLGFAAVIMAMKVRSVQALWFFTSDLVFVLLFPQLVYALFDPRANRTGSIVAFSVSLLLRIGGGEPLFNLPPLIPYPEIFSALLPGEPSSWYDPGSGAMLFPYKTLSAAAGLVLLPVVSRMSRK